MDGMEEIFNNFGSLFNVFGWWSLALIAGVTIVMVPVNMLYKKIMKTEELARLKKVVAFISVYVLSLIAVCIFTAIVNGEHLNDFGYLSGSTLALGFCSQVLWELIKLIRDYGWNKVIALIAEKIEWKKPLKALCEKYNIDTKIVDFIATEIEENYLKNIDTDAVSAIAENELNMITDIQSKLKGFVADEKLEELAMGVYQLIKNAYVKKDTSTSVSDTNVSEITVEESK